MITSFGIALCGRWKQKKEGKRSAQHSLIISSKRSSKQRPPLTRAAGRDGAMFIQVFLLMSLTSCPVSWCGPPKMRCSSRIQGFLPLNAAALVLSRSRWCHMKVWHRSTIGIYLSVEKLLLRRSLFPLWVKKINKEWWDHPLRSCVMVNFLLHAGTPQKNSSSGQVSSGQELRHTCETRWSLGTLGVSPRKPCSISKARQ